MLKILTLNDYESNYQADGLIQGLHRLLNCEVDEIPTIHHVHGGIDKDYLLSDGKVGFTGPTGNLIHNAPPPPKTPEGEVVGQIKTYDLIIMTSMRRYAKKALNDLCAASGCSPEDLPIVIIDGEDTSWFDEGYINQVQPIVFFKRELFKDNFIKIIGRRIPIWPLQFSAHVANLPEGFSDKAEDKVWDLSLNLGLTDDKRISLMNAFVEATRTYSFHSFLNLDPPHPSVIWENSGRLDWDGYMKIIAQSKITATVRGYGADTLHYWENFSTNTLTFVDDPGLVIPFPFIEGRHYIKIDYPYNNVPKLLQSWLALWPNHSEELIRIGEAAKQHCLQYHTTEKRAQYLVDIAMGYLGGKVPQYADYGI